jgi:hypothetical protein
MLESSLSCLLVTGCSKHQPLVCNGAKVWLCLPAAADNLNRRYPRLPRSLSRQFCPSKPVGLRRRFSLDPLGLQKPSDPLGLRNSLEKADWGGFTPLFKGVVPTPR